MAREIGIKAKTWKHAEAGRVDFSLRMLERIREITGIDVYVYAYVTHADFGNLPNELKEPLLHLRELWQQKFAEMKACRHLYPNLPS